VLVATSSFSRMKSFTHNFPHLYQSQRFTKEEIMGCPTRNQIITDSSAVQEKVADTANDREAP
jgi:hypothetical protein